MPCDRCILNISYWDKLYGICSGCTPCCICFYFFTLTSVVIRQLEKDKQKFGKSTWELNGEGRLKDFNQVLSQESIQFLHAKQEKYKHKIDKIKQEVIIAQVVIEPSH